MINSNFIIIVIVVMESIVLVAIVNKVAMVIYVMEVRVWYLIYSNPQSILNFYHVLI